MAYLQQLLKFILAQKHTIWNLMKKNGSTADLSLFSTEFKTATEKASSSFSKNFSTVTTWTWTFGQCQECLQWAEAPSNKQAAVANKAQTSQESKPQSENINSYVVLYLQTAQLSHGNHQPLWKSWRFNTVSAACSSKLDIHPSDGCRCQTDAGSATGSFKSLLLILLTQEKNYIPAQAWLCTSPPNLRRTGIKHPAEILHIPTMPETGLGLTAGPTIRHDQEMFFKRWKKVNFSSWCR